MTSTWSTLIGSCGLNWLEQQEFIFFLLDLQLLVGYLCTSLKLLYFSLH